MRVSFFLSILIIFTISPLGAIDVNSQEKPLLEQIITRSGNIEPDKIDLTVKGKINKLNPAYFDLSSLMVLKPHSFKHKSHWTGKVKEYTGVSFIRLLEVLGLDESATYVEVVASNNYKISIKISDLKKYDYLLAYKLDNKLYSAHDPKDDKGPVSIAINFDKHPELDWEIYKHQLVWFVEAIYVR